MTNIERVDSKFSSNKPYLFRAIYEWILDNDSTPYLLVDANKPDVMVPRQFIKDGQIVLNASPDAIDNWFIDNSAISFSARFSGKSENIFLPMTSLLAVYAQENGAGMAFPADEELVSSDGEVDSEEESVQVKEQKPTKGAHLKVIK